MQLRSIHRIVSILIVAFTLYLGVTGSLIEMVDFRTLITDPSPFDPNLMAMREDFAGPPNFRVLATGDHLAQPLPRSADLDTDMLRVEAAARRQFGKAPIEYVELRMTGGREIGQVQVRGQAYRFDAISGDPLGPVPPTLQENGPPAALRNDIKHLHRMTTFGNWALWINIVVSLALATLIVTGVIVYWRVWMARRRLKRPNPYWQAGGWWRALHRSISISAALFLTVTTLSGAWLAVESLLFGMYLSAHSPMVLMRDASSPLVDAVLPERLRTTLAAYSAAAPGDAIRVLRLRDYGTMEQGVIIGGGPVARQFVFDSVTGAPASLTEHGYPATGFPFGWQAHQWAKSIHRGDFFGLPGRVTSLLAGLAMVYLSVSGIVLYATMWSRRRSTGRGAFLWK